MIKLGTKKEHRYKVISQSVIDQLEKLKNIDIIKSVGKQSNTAYIEAQDMMPEKLIEKNSKSILDKNKEALSKFNQNLKKGLNHNSKDDKK